MIHAENIPDALRSLPQWVAWKYVENGGAKPRKIPVDPRTGRNASTSDPTTWGTLDDAVGANTREGMAGIGTMFAAGGGITGIDLDDCVVGGQINPAALQLIAHFNSYCEISPSGNGVKIWVRGTKPPGSPCKVEMPAGSACSRVEVYDRGRYFAVTGKRITSVSGEVEFRQAELDGLCTKLAKIAAAKTKPTTTAPEVITAAPVIAPAQAEPSTPSDAVAKCRNYLSHVPGAISGQGGDKATFRVACIIWEFGVGDAEAMALISDWNTQCTPPWLPADLARKLAIAQTKVRADGRFGIRDGHVAPGHTIHRDLPKWITDLPTSGKGKLTIYQRAIMQVIADACGPQPLDGFGSLGIATLGMSTIAERAKVSRPTAVKHLRVLVSMGVLTKIETGGIAYTTGECLANRYAVPGQHGLVYQPTVVKVLATVPHPTNPVKYGG